MLNKPNRLLLLLGEKFRTVDKGFYFPLGLVFISPFLVFLYGWITAYLVLLVVSYIHFMYLLWNPYVQDSDFYRYRSLSAEFFAKNARYRPLMDKKQLAQLHLFMWICLYCFFMMPTFVVGLAPVYILALVVSLCNQTIEVLNIIYRPQLPKEICSYHFYLQRRYSPTSEFIAHKVVPLCQNALYYGVKGYSGLAIGWKGYYGALEIDPVRNFVCNKANGFPTSHVWNESTLSAWSSFQRLDAVKGYSKPEMVNTFLKGEKELTQKFEDMVHGIVKYNKPS